MFDPSFWFMFPVALVFSAIAMMAGIGGAILFSPFFILVLGLEPVLAIATGLFIEVFGFSSGVIGHWRAKHINFDVVRWLIFFTVPATALGVILSYYVNSLVIRAVLFGLLVYLVFKFLFERFAPGTRTTCALDNPCRAVATFGGLLMGLVSSGLGEIDEYIFLKRLKLTPAIATGTSVLLVAASALVGVLAHVILLANAGELSVFAEVFSILVFAVPGVIIGAQIGVRTVQYVPEKSMRIFLGVLFAVLAVSMLL